MPRTSFVLIALATASVCTAFPQYRVVEVPFVTGAAKVNFTNLAMNDRGQVTWGFEGSSWWAPFYDPDQGTRLIGPYWQMPRGTVGKGINSQGQVCGTFDFPSFMRWGFVTGPDGRSPKLFSPPQGFLNVEPQDVNDAGQVVCFLRRADGNHGMLWTPNQGFVDFGWLETGKSTEPAAVNELGWCAGTASKDADAVGRAFLWTPKGGLESLGVLPGYDQSRGLDVNDTGLVVGFCLKVGLPDKAFAWTRQAGMVDLGTVEGAGIDAFSVNEHGWMAGLVRKTPFGGAVYVPGEGWARLNGLLEPGSIGHDILTTWSINEDGHILCLSRFGGVLRLVRLVPVQ